MNKKVLLIAALFSVVFIVVGVQAGTKANPVISMNNPGYDKHTKGIVEFGHQKHVKEYGAKCGECHHDDKGKPLSELKSGDEVQSCAACHKEFGKKPKGEKLKKIEKIKKYHKDALHANCQGCHKDWNKKKGLKKNDPKAAPATCNACHPKTKE